MKVKLQIPGDDVHQVQIIGLWMHTAPEDKGVPDRVVTCGKTVHHAVIAFMGGKAVVVDHRVGRIFRRRHEPVLAEPGHRVRGDIAGFEDILHDRIACAGGLHVPQKREIAVQDDHGMYDVCSCQVKKFFQRPVL